MKFREKGVLNETQEEIWGIKLKLIELK